MTSQKYIDKVAMRAIMRPQVVVPVLRRGFRGR